MIYMTFGFILVFGGLGFVTRTLRQRLLAALLILIADVAYWRWREADIMVSGSAHQDALQMGYWMILGLVVFGTFAVFGLGILARAVAGWGKTDEEDPA